MAHKLILICSASLLLVELAELVDEAEDPELPDAVVETPVAVDPVVVDPVLEVDLTTVTGILEPLVAGSTVRVEQFIPTTSGQMSVRFNCLSRGPVGPDSYFQDIFKFKKLTWMGSLSGYCSSPHCPRRYSQSVGVDESEGTNVPLLEDDGVKE